MKRWFNDIKRNKLIEMIDYLMTQNPKKGAFASADNIILWKLSKDDWVKLQNESLIFEFKIQEKVGTDPKGKPRKVKGIVPITHHIKDSQGNVEDYVPIELRRNIRLSLLTLFSVYPLASTITIKKISDKEFDISWTEVGLT